MEGSSRPPVKLQKRKSREREDLSSAHMSGALNAPSANSSQPLTSSTMSAAEKERRSKWRLANPFHSKEKDRPSDRKESAISTVDSAYGSSEPSSSTNPSFASNQRPISYEQWDPSLAPSQAPATSVIAPTPPAHESYAPPPVPPQSAYASQENISKETHLDNRTGNIITTVTTTTTTTTTTTGPGGTTTVQLPTGADPSRGSVTSTSGPSPPSPAPPVLANYQQGSGYQQDLGHQHGLASQHGSIHHPNPEYQHGLASQHGSIHQPNSMYQQGPGSQQDLEHRPHISIPGDSVPPMPTHQYQGQGLAPQATNVESSSPPLPNKSNIRNRVELDSVSPGRERPNPMADPVSPLSPNSPARANFSYPARAPPQGVPRQVPSQYFTAEQHGGESSQPGYADPNYPASSRIPVGSQQLRDYQQKQSTLANLKLAAAGIHGAGETLRGTFNDTFDKRWAGADSAAHAKNLAVIQAGRAEIEAAQAHRTRSSVELTHTQHPAQPQPLYAKTPYQGPPVSGSQIEGRTAKLSGFVRKMKDGSMALSRDQAGNSNVGTHP